MFYMWYIRICIYIYIYIIIYMIFFLFGWMIRWDFLSGPWIFVPRIPRIFHGPRRFFSSSPWWLLQGKKATSATEMDGIFISCWMSERFQRNGSVQSPICFIVAMLFREACCFERNPWMHTVYVRYTSTRQPLVVCLAKNSPVFFYERWNLDSMAV